MSSKWTDSNSSGEKVDFSKFFQDEFAVILLRGKNNFGDAIYSYVKVSIPNLNRLQKSLQAREAFIPSDFGEVVAAGTGNPSDEVKAEVARQYPIIEQQAPGYSSSSASSSSTPIVKKAWDEY